MFAMGFAALGDPLISQDGDGIQLAADGQEETAQEVPVDTLPHVKVKKTDNPTNEPEVETSLDLVDPENLKYDVGEYDEKSGMYKVGTKLGDNFLSTPTLMTPEEYATWNTRKLLNDYFKMRNDSL